MTTTFLAYFPSPPRGVWHLGPVPIRAYALFIIVGIVAALLIGDRRWENRGGERGVIYDIALWAVPFGLVGGRLYHIATDWRTYFGNGGAGLGAALRIWDGGLGIWGAIALGGVGAWIACRRRDIPLPAFGDAVAPCIVLAQAIGRLGNYFNQELYGRETTMPWGMEIFYRRDPSGYVDVHSLDGVSTGQVALVVQPTFLYELLWNVLVFVVLIYVDRRFTIGHGRLFALYVAGYCVGRFWIELLRDDPATHIAGIRINSFTSTFVFIGAVVYLILAPKGREDPATLGGTRPAEEPAVPEPAAVASASGEAAAAKAADPERDKPVDVAETAGSAGSEEGGPGEAEAEKTEPEAEAAVQEQAGADTRLAQPEETAGEDTADEEPAVPEADIPAASAEAEEAPEQAPEDHAETGPEAVTETAEPGTAETDIVNGEAAAMEEPQKTGEAQQLAIDETEHAAERTEARQSVDETGSVGDSHQRRSRWWGRLRRRRQ
jgi:prolipoprotein diacylglyceryl transferase